MSIVAEVRFVAEEIASYQVNHGLLGRKEMVEMIENIIKYHELSVEPDNYDWVEGLVMQYTHELKHEWRIAK